MASADGNARSVEPLLANSLVGKQELEVLFEGVMGVRKDAKRGRLLRLGTGVQSVDDVLGGALEEGRVVGVSSQASGESGDLCLTLLANSLLQDTSSTAAIIDTTGHVDIMRLYMLILTRLRSNTALLDDFRTCHASTELQAEDVATKVLDRVQIMRVFDLVGVMEAVDEIKEKLEGRDMIDRTKAKVEMKEVQIKGPPLRKTAIVDSEEEDEEDEMLFDPGDATFANPIALPVAPSAPEPLPESVLCGTPSGECTTSGSRMTIILIDNLAQVISPLLKRDYIQTHALSSSFLLILAKLTHAHRLHTLLLNPLTFPRSPLPNPADANANQPAPPPQQQYQPPPPPSIFTSSKGVPALGSVWGPFLDLHLLVTKMPKRKVDARIIHADVKETAGRAEVRKGVEMVSVVEVVLDRWSGRGGAWGTFSEGPQGIRDV